MLITLSQKLLVLDLKELLYFMLGTSLKEPKQSHILCDYDSLLQEGNRYENQRAYDSRPNHGINHIIY